MTVAAYTKPGSNYPGYMNATRLDDGSVRLTVRSDPKIQENGCHICVTNKDRERSFSAVCTPGDENCNNNALALWQTTAWYRLQVSYDNEI